MVLIKPSSEAILMSQPNKFDSCQDNLINDEYEHNLNRRRNQLLLEV